VHNKTTANFCDWFTPDPSAFDGRERQAENEARRKLDALFGSAGATDGAAAGADEKDTLRNAAENLFRK
jgi:hypothetical protein